MSPEIGEGRKIGSHGSFMDPEIGEDRKIGSHGT